MTQIQETAITQRVEFALEQLDSANELFMEFCKSQMMSEEELKKISDALGKIDSACNSMLNGGVDYQEELLKVKNKNKKDE